MKDFIQYSDLTYEDKKQYEMNIIESHIYHLKV